MKADLCFDFTDIPPVGLRVRYSKQFLTLKGSRPYTRADGTPGTILEWRADDGRECTSGLRAKSVVWVKK